MYIELTVSLLTYLTLIFIRNTLCLVYTTTSTNYDDHLRTLTLFEKVLIMQSCRFHLAVL